MKSKSRPNSLRWAALLVLGLTAALWIGWIGFMASDDGLYYIAAARWADAPPFAGDNHWATRFPIVLSFAGALLAVGKNMLAFHLTSIGWFVALIAIGGLFTASLAGARAGWIAATLIATMPTLATFGSVVNCDMPEAFFLIAGAWILGAGDKGARPGLGLLSGLCFGVAALCRETAILPLVGLLPIFLIGKPVQRKTLIACGIGFAIVLAGEALFQYHMTGAPLRRYDIAAHHDSHIDRAANMEGNVLVHPAIDPLLVLFINDDFALLFWLALVALVGGTWGRIALVSRRRLVVFASMALAGFLLVSVLTHTLVLNPRYFAMAALLACFFVAIWLAAMGPRSRAIILGLAVAANLLALSVANNHFRWPSEALLIAARAHPNAIIVTDRAILVRADLPRAFAGLTNIEAGRPQTGKLYLASDDAAPAGGTAIDHYPSPPTMLGSLIKPIGLGTYLPARVARRLIEPNPSVTLWSISPGTRLP